MLHFIILPSPLLLSAQQGRRARRCRSGQLTWQPVELQMQASQHCHQVALLLLLLLLQELYSLQQQEHHLQPAQQQAGPTHPR
jgi:hypothetical protein